MSNYYFAGLDDDAVVDPLVDDVDATAAVTAEDTLAAQQQAAQAAAALAEQELLAQQQLLHRRHHHRWQRLNGTTFRTRIGSWQDQKAQRLAAMGRLIRVSGGSTMMTGYAGDLQYRVVNPHGALLRWRDGSLVQNAKAVAPGTIVLGTPRGDGYIVEVSALSGWLNALDLEQLTSAAPSPVLASGEFTGADDPMAPLMPATGCPQGTEWSDWYGKCVPHIPAPPPPPVSSVHASGEYVGDGGMMPATGCPAGTYWHEFYQKCVPNIPAPPPALPDTLDEWRRQHQTSGAFATGYGWEYAAGAPPPNALPQDQQAPTSSVTVNVHPAVSPSAPAAAHAAAHAADANAHAQAAQAVAAHPAAHGSGADKHAVTAAQHANAATQHASAVAESADPHQAYQHAHLATHHAHMAQRHASHIRREGHHRGWHEGREHHGLFQNLFGHPMEHEHGFSRQFHAHPEWHHHGHPAWRSGINPMWMGHRAECAHRSHPRGLFGWLFGGHRRYCALERIYHPQGWVTYRITPSGLQEGALLDEDMTAANAQYEAAAGQAAPTADAGPLPGSDEKAAGAIEPDHTADDDTAGDEGGTDDAADTATTTDTATKGWFTGWSQEGLALQHQDELRTQHQGMHGQGGGRGGMRHGTARQGRDGGMGMGRNGAYHGNYGGGMGGMMDGEEDDGWLARLLRKRRRAHHHHHHHMQPQIDPSLALDDDTDDDLDAQGGGLAQ